MNSGLYVLDGLISMVEKGVFGSLLIKKRRYWAKGVTAEEILRHTKNKEVRYVDAVQDSVRGKIYLIIAIQDPNYRILTMKTCGTLGHLEG